MSKKRNIRVSRMKLDRLSRELNDEIQAIIDHLETNGLHGIAFVEAKANAVIARSYLENAIKMLTVTP
jgi:hypothetical protein